MAVDQEKKILKLQNKNLKLKLKLSHFQNAIHYIEDWESVLQAKGYSPSETDYLIINILNNLTIEEVKTKKEKDLTK